MLQTFLPLFLMTFGICLFVVLMQFLWKYIDDMVGKGLSITVLSEMFFYAALCLVPMALPLSILLASLMTFGNLGERLELLAMKSAGVSLIHSMRPLTVVIAMISIGAFFFQNNVMPIAQVKMYTLLYSIKQKSPEMEIPEGVFYKEIPGHNVYVKHKDQKNGMLKELMIYDYSEGFNNARIIVADSGRLKVSADKLYLVLSLFSGESFENLKTIDQTSKIKSAVPYRRETFATRDILIQYDANFNRTDESFMQNQYMGKNLKSLQTSIDSMTLKLDSIKRENAKLVIRKSYKEEFHKTGVDEKGNRMNEYTVDSLEQYTDTIHYNLDSLFLALSPGQRSSILNNVKTQTENMRSDMIFKASNYGDDAYKLRRHKTEWHYKFTLSFACLIFFFIGAPLGAIIRKGGLGTPVVISVLLFIFYYIVNNIGLKMARDGIWPAWEGMWLSSAVLTPLGVFLTYKAVNDSVILNADTYLNALKNLVGKRPGRKIEKKEVIIYAPDYDAVVPRLRQLTEDCKLYIQGHRRWINYFTYWKSGGKDATAETIALEMESIVEELANSDQNLLLNKLMDYPIIGNYHQLNANISPKMAMAIGFFLPIGLPIYLLAVYQRKLLRQDILTVQKVSEELESMIIFSLHLSTKQEN